VTDLHTESRLVDAYLTLLNERRLDDLGEILASDMTSHLRIGDLAGLDKFRGAMEMIYEAFPGLVYQAHEIVLAPGRGVIRYWFDAVHRGPFFGVPASHRMVHLEGIEMLHIADGRIVEVWNYADVFGLAVQIRAADPLALRLP